MNIIGGVFNWMEMRRRRQNIIALALFGSCCTIFAVIAIIMAIVTSIANTIESGTVRNLYGESYATACDPRPHG